MRAARMEKTVVFVALLATGCSSLQERVATYNDARLCAELERGSAHSKQVYRTEASRRSLTCAGLAPGPSGGLNTFQIFRLKQGDAVIL